MVNDSFLDTQKSVKQMIDTGSDGVVIDPRLFKQYNINQVPAVVIRKSGNNTCLKTQSCWSQENFDVITGDIGLASALQEIAEHGDNASIAQKLLQIWRQA